MTLTMPTVTQGIFPTQCQLNCNNSINNLVQEINQSSLSTSNNYTATSQTGSKYQVPFYCIRIINLVDDVFSARTYNGQFTITEYANETIPYSVNNVLIPSLTAETCSFENNSVTRRDSPNLVTHEQYVYFYKIELFDENDITNFRMYGSPINNFQYSGATPQNGWGAIFELALEYSGGTITYQNPYYCI